MKKQALAFFTMFSLILMLSIYYITLPKEANVNKKDISVIKKIDDTSKNTKKEEKAKNDEVIANPSIDEKSKNEAIIKNEAIKEQEQLQNEYSSLISKAGFKNHVEIKDKTIYVNVLNKEEDKSVASQIMKTIYAKAGSAFFIEVSFNSK